MGIAFIWHTRVSEKKSNGTPQSTDTPSMETANV
jgi:hypothetical protein